MSLLMLVILGAAAVLVVAYLLAVSGKKRR
jgi:hypothetical protein